MKKRATKVPYRDGWMIRRSGRIAFGPTFVQLLNGTGRWKYLRDPDPRIGGPPVWIDIVGWNPLEHDRDFFLFARTAIATMPTFGKSCRALWTVFVGGFKRDKRSEVERLLNLLGFRIPSE